MKAKDKPTLQTSRNSRTSVHKYYKIKGDDIHRFAQEGGRCYKCNKVTDAFCDKCEKWTCKNHSVIPNKEDYGSFCLDCGN